MTVMSQIETHHLHSRLKAIVVAVMGLTNSLRLGVKSP